MTTTSTETLTAAPAATWIEKIAVALDDYDRKAAIQEVLRSKLAAVPGLTSVEFTSGGDEFDLYVVVDGVGSNVAAELEGIAWDMEEEPGISEIRRVDGRCESCNVPVAGDEGWLRDLFQEPVLLCDPCNETLPECFGFHDGFVAGRCRPCGNCEECAESEPPIGDRECPSCGYPSNEDESDHCWACGNSL